MDISTNLTNLQTNYANNSKEVKTNFSEKISQEEVVEIKTQIAERAKEMMMNSTVTQSELSAGTPENDFMKEYGEFQSFLEGIGYSGKPIAELSQSEASELVSEDGFFGITQTSERIADFVINGAAGDENLMRAGREGMLQGFKEAEAMWGGELPEISQKTMQAAIEKVDKAMNELGFSLIDTEV